MPKRFTATEKWTDPWFCSLTDNEKLFWLFLLDNCDNAGIWRVNWFVFGCYVKNFKYNPEPFKDRVIVMDKEKWFIPKFVTYQYGNLNPNCLPHLSVIRILQKHTVTEQYAKGCLTLKDKDKDKDKAKDKDSPIISPCPHQEIVDLYHSILPGLPMVKELTEARKAFIKGRWAASKERQSLEWWKDFFKTYVLASPFLCGNVIGRDGGRPFKATLEWLVRPANFAKVIEGYYLPDKSAQAQKPLSTVNRVIPSDTWKPEYDFKIDK